MYVEENVPKNLFHRDKKDQPSKLKLKLRNLDYCLIFLFWHSSKKFLEIFPFFKLISKGGKNENTTRATFGRKHSLDFKWDSKEIGLKESFQNEVDVHIALEKFEYKAVLK